MNKISAFIFQAIDGWRGDGHPLSNNNNDEDVNLPSNTENYGQGKR